MPPGLHAAPPTPTVNTLQIHRSRRLGLAASLLAAATWAQADDDHRAAVPLASTYVQECGSCHVAYAPGLLPAASWQRLMGSLRTHFGTDASVDPPVQASLTDWLVAHAATRRRRADAPPQDRITRADWFVREHREVPQATWQHPAVAGPAQCNACHTRAEAGSFSEREIRLPSNVSPRSR